jgi:hypothetical protein
MALKPDQGTKDSPPIETKQVRPGEAATETKDAPVSDPPADRVSTDDEAA